MSAGRRRSDRLRQQEAEPDPDHRGRVRYPTTRKEGPHQLRHYYASITLTDGLTITELAKYLGHHDPAAAQGLRRRKVSGGARSPAADGSRMSATLPAEAHLLRRSAPRSTLAALPFISGTPKVIFAGYDHLGFRDAVFDQEQAQLLNPAHPWA
jgi:hypothetical protein